MKKIYFLIITLLLFIAPIKADTITYINAGSNYVNSTYTYPYYIEVNNSVNKVPAMCLSYDQEIVSGKSWLVTITDLSGLSRNYFGAAWFLDDAISLFGLGLSSIAFVKKKLK